MASEPSFESILIDATPEKVFAHFTDPAALVRWMGEYALLDPRPGGEFTVDIGAVPIRGSYVELEPPRRLVLSWRQAGSDRLPPGASTVEITLTTAAGGTRVEIVHHGLPEAERAGFELGWRHYGARLHAAASGADPGPDPGMPRRTEPEPTIFEWAGGEPAFSRWLNTFYDLVEQEEDLARLFGGRVSDEHRHNVTAWWSEVMGGPARYTNELGGYAHMVAKHSGLGITTDQRLRFVTLLSTAADMAELPADPEFRAALMGYAEWATRLAVHNSQPGAEVVEQAPVSRWGWGVAPPYRG